MLSPSRRRALAWALASCLTASCVADVPGKAGTEDGTEGHSDQGAFVEKGYVTGTKPDVSDVCVIGVPPPFSTEPISNAWGWAFLVAVVEWDSKTDVNMRAATLDTTDCGSTIFINQWPLDNAGDAAQGTFPSNGRVGNLVTLNSAYNGTDCAGGTGDIHSFSFAEKVRIAIHELGHNLGFAHGDEAYFGGVQHVSGTAVYNPFVGWSYDSVMWSGGCIGTSGAVTGTLSEDDVLTANKRF